MLIYALSSEFVVGRLSVGQLEAHSCEVAIKANRKLGILERRFRFKYQRNIHVYINLVR